MKISNCLFCSTKGVSYAVKRVKLPANKSKKDRVIREVKVMANLQHNNIVRYNFTWIERPPQGNTISKFFSSELRMNPRICDGKTANPEVWCILMDRELLPDQT